MKHCTEPRFVCKVKLIVTPTQHKWLNTKLEVSRLVYNECLAEAKKRLRKCRCDTRWSEAKKLTGIPKRQLFDDVKNDYGFCTNGMTKFENRRWTKDHWIRQHHLKERQIRLIAERAFLTVNPASKVKKKKFKFLRKKELFTLVDNSDGRSILLKDDHIIYKMGHNIIHSFKIADKYINENLSYIKVKEITKIDITKKIIKGKETFWALIIAKGRPLDRYIKNNHKIGIDVGVSTVAIVGLNGRANTLSLCYSGNIEKQIKRLSRKLDRQRRANNKSNYNENGTNKRNVRWIYTKAMRKTKSKMAELNRRLAEFRKNNIGQLTNIILEIGSHINMEKLDIHNMSSRKSKFKLGRSISKHSPSRLIAELRRKAATCNEFSTYSTKLSSTCICGKIKKKELSERVHSCNCGIKFDRDLLSAYLAMFVDNEKLQLGDAQKAWPGFCRILLTNCNNDKMANVFNTYCVSQSEPFVEKESQKKSKNAERIMPSVEDFSNDLASESIMTPTLTESLVS